ncbi:MAG: hypothetical protein KGS72_15255 [Cyanobacteria bacterium REEB67]|nr:hypothetical protein [Cyanobacteria bacterium REEB67]
MNQSTRVITKWMARLSLLATLILPALFCTAWRSNVINHTRETFFDQGTNFPISVLDSPYMELPINFLLLFAAVAITYMFAELRYGRHADAEIKDLLKTSLQKWYIAAPVFAAFIWAAFFANPSMFYTRLSWFWLTEFFVALLLFKTPAFRSEVEDDDQAVLENASASTEPPRVRRLRIYGQRILDQYDEIDSAPAADEDGVIEVGENGRRASILSVFPRKRTLG